MNNFILRTSLFICKNRNAITKLPVCTQNLCKIKQSSRQFSLFSYHLNKKPTLDDLLKEDESDKKEKQKKSYFEEQTMPMKSRIAIVSVVSAGVCGFWLYLKTQKEDREIVQREEDCSKVDIGNADFTLTDHTGKRVTKKDFMGKWLLLYFGFTHCPDICPEELDRITEIVSEINESKGMPNLQPVFMSVDPRRDTPEAMTEYLKDFHPSFIGLTGTEEEIKLATKSFRVYYSLGPKDDDNDYIVDHSIIMYLMDPRGHFVDYYGSRSTPTTDVVSGITKRMKNYMRLHG